MCTQSVPDTSETEVEHFLFRPSKACLKHGSPEYRLEGARQVRPFTGLQTQSTPTSRLPSDDSSLGDVAAFMRNHSRKCVFLLLLPGS